MDNETTILNLKLTIKDFCKARNWDQFHDPKELSIGIVTEACELLDIFRFKTKEQMSELLKDPTSRDHIEEELADTFYFLLRFAQINNIDLSDALSKKMKKNEEKYPLEKSRNNNKKYSEF